jgi:hypothetical protein
MSFPFILNEQVLHADGYQSTSGMEDASVQPTLVTQPSGQSNNRQVKGC